MSQENKVSQESYKPIYDYILPEPSAVPELYRKYHTLPVKKTFHIIDQDNKECGCLLTILCIDAQGGIDNFHKFSSNQSVPCWADHAFGVAFTAGAANAFDELISESSNFYQNATEKDKPEYLRGRKYAEDCMLELAKENIQILCVDDLNI